MTEKAIAHARSPWKWVIGLLVLVIAAGGGWILWELRDKSNPNAPRPDAAEVEITGSGEKTDSPIKLIEKHLSDSLSALEKTDGYTCRFIKNERVKGELIGFQTMQLKLRHKPFSVYYRFLAPDGKKNDQAIFVEGENDGEMFGKRGQGALSFLGWQSLNPTGAFVMRYSRRPVTSSGMLKLVQRLQKMVAAKPTMFAAAKVSEKRAKAGDRECDLLEISIPKSLGQKHGSPLAIVRIYFDHENRFPIRYERHEWNADANAPWLIGEYTYADVKPEKLTDEDFDRKNPDYN